MFSFVLCCFAQTLTTLDLYDNQIGNKGAEHLGVALRRNSVRVETRKQVYSSWFRLFFVISQTLTTLGLSMNQIGDKGAEHLGVALLTNSVRVEPRNNCIDRVFFCSLLFRTDT